MGFKESQVEGYEIPPVFEKGKASAVPRRTAASSPRAPIVEPHTPFLFTQVLKRLMPKISKHLEILKTSSQLAIKRLLSRSAKV